jgi:hypothetical protein
MKCWDAREGCILKNCVVCTLYQIKEDEMFRACGMHRKDENAYKILAKSLKRRD